MTVQNPSYAIRTAQDQIQISGDLRMRDAGAFWRELTAATQSLRGHVNFELSQLSSADSGIVALLLEQRNALVARGVEAEVSGANHAVAAIVTLYTAHEEAKVAVRSDSEGLIEQIGGAAAEAIDEGKALLDFVGRLVLSIAALVQRPRVGNWKGFSSMCEKVGANAIPIVLLINFLVGFVMGFQSAKQLKTYGANIYVADLVGISLTRELAPLMTAIIVCGRTGAAFAAEIGSMKVNEEIDALRTLGLRPFEWLVVPRAAALLLVVPVLTMLADVIGIFGGMVVAVTDLDVTPQGYLRETLVSVLGWDIGTGLIKSAVFALTIALISCQQGMATSGGAEEVGRRTTASVVMTLFALVTMDALFTVVFRMLEI